MSIGNLADRIIFMAGMGWRDCGGLRGIVETGHALSLQRGYGRGYGHHIIHRETGHALSLRKYGT